jgi:iron(III) transport system ATP-binding protein
MTPLIQARNLRKAFGAQTVFASVSFEIEAGQHLALLGPSGCGKSTLLRLLAGLDAPDEGQLWIDGQLVSEPGRSLVPPHERQLAMVFQDLALWPTLSAVENVILGMANLKLPRRDRRAQALAALETCQIAALADRKPAGLSVGQQQRVALARALAVKPRLLFLDEPFSGLDLTLKEELLAELKTQAATHATLVLVTHDPGEALALCPHALVLEGGHIVESGWTAKLLKRPVSKTLRAFADSLSRADS